MRTLIIDDDPDLSASLASLMASWGHEVSLAGGVAAGLVAAAAEEPELILLDQNLGDGTGLEALPKLKAAAPEAWVIMVTGEQSTRLAVEAMRAGAEDYLEKPVDIDELKVLVEKSAERAAMKRELMELRDKDGSHLFLRHPAMREVYSVLERVAAAGRATVLISGETGTGKEHAARLLHRYSPRAEKPFIELHCAALPETLLESELFGYEAGAFTDARRSKAGLFEAAQGGTLFLDEVGELPLGMQTKLLKVLEDRQLRRLGGLKPVALDVRLVTASNRDLEEEVRAGRFRADLYYRLKVVTLSLPPLRERPEDIRALARHFFGQFNAEFGRRLEGLDAELLDALALYPWPGNIRELRNAIERTVILAPGPRVGLNDLPEDLRRDAPSTGSGQAPGPSRAPASPSQAAGAAAEPADPQREALLALLERHRWNRTRAAGEMGVSRPTFLKRLKDHGLG